MRYLLILLFFFPIQVWAIPTVVLVQDTIAKAAEEIKYDDSSTLSTPTFDNATLEKFKNDRAFNYEQVQQENWWTLFKDWLWEQWVKLWTWIIGDYRAHGIVAILIELLPYIIILGIVVFALWLFYKLNPGASLFGTREKPEIFLSEEEEIIKTANISELIDNALANKQYRLAIRYFYLLILQKLSEENYIEYKSNKTNSEYISEINSEKLKQAFRRATSVYDYVWYGNFEVTEADFLKARPTFTSLRDKIIAHHE